MTKHCQTWNANHRRYFYISLFCLVLQLYPSFECPGVDRGSSSSIRKKPGSDFSAVPSLRMRFCRSARTQGINFKQQVKLFHTVRFLCGRRNGPNILPLNSLKTLQTTGFPSHIMGPLFLFWCFWVTGNNNYVGT